MTEAAVVSSTPSFSDFDPTEVPYQVDVLNDMDFEYDYSLGTHEILLSGSAGSAKSILMAHAAIKHLATYAGSRGCMGRQSMPDLRDTIFTKVLEHLTGTVKTDGTVWREGVDFGFSRQNCSFWLSNGSELISRSWHDKNWAKLGSLELSFAIVEEVTENRKDHWPAWTTLLTRCGRLPHVPRSWIMGATNPESPKHPAYKYFQIGERMAGRTEGLDPRRHVYFSKTADNKFLPSWYLDTLKGSLDPRMYMRLGEGLWVEISTENVYHAYSAKNFRDHDYVVDENRPIYLNFDFNIGEGKPMSACFSQVKGLGPDTSFHFFGEAIVHGADTGDLLEEIAGQDVLEHKTQFIVHGDATGASRSTKSKKSDYDIIREFLANYRQKDGDALDFKVDVPKANPPIRTRHNIVNGYCRNALGKIRLFVYKPCKLLDEGFRLVTTKPNGLYVEDDRNEYQHVTTAAGYHILRVHKHVREGARPGIRTAQYR